MQYVCGKITAEPSLSTVKNESKDFFVPPPRAPAFPFLPPPRLAKPRRRRGKEGISRRRRLFFLSPALIYPGTISVEFGRQRREFSPDFQFEDFFSLSLACIVAEDNVQVKAEQKAQKCDSGKKLFRGANSPFSFLRQPKVSQSNISPRMHVVLFMPQPVFF